MFKLRILFEKTGSAKYISHLDLMNVFRRSFVRAQIPIYYTKGFNPHPYLSVALPLPTAFDSKAELLDFDIDADDMPLCFVARLNEKLPAGIRVLDVYERVTQPKAIAYASYTIRVHGTGVAAADVKALFAREELMVLKKSKSGETEVNIREFIHTLDAVDTDDGVVIDTVVCAGTVKTINPSYLVKAMEQYGEGWDIDYATYCRNEIYTDTMEVFR